MNMAIIINVGNY